MGLLNLYRDTDVIAPGHRSFEKSKTQTAALQDDTQTRGVKSVSPCAGRIYSAEEREIRGTVEAKTEPEAHPRGAGEAGPGDTWFVGRFFWCSGSSYP